eukprot:scaffold1350_cov56-Cyclotella_meneghiniana.AAC.3
MLLRNICYHKGEVGKKEFVEGKNIDALILGCACCGSRSIDVEDSYIRQSLSNLQCLKLDEDEAEQHLDRIERYNLELPIDDTGLTKTFNLWKAWRIWPQKNLKKTDSSASYYFLHPELVELIGDDEAPKTNQDIQMKKIYFVHGFVHHVGKMWKREKYLPYH